jgi:hypothetical protein
VAFAPYAKVTGAADNLFVHCGLQCWGYRLSGTYRLVQDKKVNRQIYQHIADYIGISVDVSADLSYRSDTREAIQWSFHE